jgi:uncharacterized protein YjbI with pentapeptide repeats
MSWRTLGISLVFLAIAASVRVRADIYRWDTGEVIPGTEGITPGPGVDLSGWNSDAHNLRYGTFGEYFEEFDLTGANFGGSWLDNANFHSTNLTNANLAGAILTNAVLSFQDIDDVFVGSNLTGANLTGANLTSAVMGGTTLTNADLTGAIVRQAELSQTTSRGFTKGQLYSTASYGSKDLEGIRLMQNDLAGWDFSGQNLQNAWFWKSNLADADLQGSTLTRANLFSSNLKGANLTGANLHSASLRYAVLHAAILDNTVLTDADLSSADARGSSLHFAAEAEFIAQNMIWSDGSIRGLELVESQSLPVRNFDNAQGGGPFPIVVHDHMKLSDGYLAFSFNTDPWRSTISFEPGIPVQIEGHLNLSLDFDNGVDPTSQVGRTLDMFDWTGVSPTGEFNGFLLYRYDWDLSRFFTTGEVTLLAAGGVIAGDATGDGKVDLADFGELKANFGTAGGRTEGDSNGDGQVDLSDFGLLKLNFGKGAPGNAAVPEPATWVLLLVAVSLFPLTARHRR